MQITRRHLSLAAGMATAGIPLAVVVTVPRMTPFGVAVASKIACA